MLEKEIIDIPPLFADKPIKALSKKLPKPAMYLLSLLLVVSLT